jgi:hypothetical protein
VSGAGRSGEALRRAALEALGPHADERAIDALRHSAFTVTTGAARWNASAGPIEAHVVTLALDAKRLGRLRAVPAIADALCAAVASAIAAQPGETLLELALRWAPGAAAARVGYRDAPAPPVSLRDALAEYLDGAGEPSVAPMIASAVLTASRPADGELALHIDRVSWDALRTNPHALATLTRAVRDLFGSENVQIAGATRSDVLDKVDDILRR